MLRLHYQFFFPRSSLFLLFWLPPRATLFPYTTLFRSLSSRSSAAEMAESKACTARLRSRTSAARANLYSSLSESSFRSEEHTSELQSRRDLVCRLLLEKKKIDMRRGVYSALSLSLYTT